MVLTILAILMGILFPVFSAARRAAQAASCVSNFGQAGKATLLYAADYEERFMPANHQPGKEPDPLQDRVWPQILLPYLGGAFKTFDCPADPSPMGFGGSFDPDLVPGDYTARYYDAALHSDLGYNAYYLAPIVRVGDVWEPHPRSTTEMSPRTLMFVESRADGGGSYLVAPPCRYIADHNLWTDTFLDNAAQTSIPQDTVYTPIVGWDVSGQQAAYPNGGVGARHGDRVNVARVDASAKAISMKALTAGCLVRTGVARLDHRSVGQPVVRRGIGLSARDGSRRRRTSLPLWRGQGVRDPGAWPESAARADGTPQRGFVRRS